MNALQAMAIAVVISVCVSTVLLRMSTLRMPPRA